ncbi:hypothetical protein [Buchnera aphidicola]|uniref:Cytochrome bo(3) ubiquinol oxidase subunit 3 n=1 Tax=Buchnera aphidicola subsp. Tuberolachnus salignus TaxID=98804 RepID=A0A160SZ97_BUCTT|nr:hypothetical protein [Buchnera aphidicola]CUR53276.1 Cytochrome bo(3) ubiquinol oxidase subunit 3 [Buchnera aphidicola (Tuberolachnus salignus)]
MIFQKKKIHQYSIKKDIQKDKFENNVFGFWLYLMSECIIFSILFVVFFIMNKNRQLNQLFDQKIVSLWTIFLETFFLLSTSFLNSFLVYILDKISFKYVLYLILSILFCGMTFLYIEISELYKIFCFFCLNKINGFFSSFFALLGMHCLHVFFALLWTFVLLLHIFKNTIIKNVYKNFVCLNLFWHFLDIIWLFIITYIYLLNNII